MGFTLQSRPNPLALLGQAAGDASLTIGRQNRQERILNNALGLLNNADDDPTAFIGSISRLNPENQRLALGALDLQREKQAKAKDQAQAQQLAQAYGITHVPGMGSKDVLELVKQKEKYLEEAKLQGLTDQKKDQALQADRERARQFAAEVGINIPEGATYKEALDQFKATKPSKEALRNQPIKQEQLDAIERTKAKLGEAYYSLKPEKLKNELIKEGVSEIVADKEARLRIEEIKSGQEEQKNLGESYKYHKEFISGILKGKEKFDKTEAIVQAIQKYSDKDLPKPLLVEFLDKLGIPLGFLENADAEALEKLAMDLTTGIGDDYRGRILQSEFQTFLNRIPTLANSVEGRKEIAKNLLMFNELNKLKYEAYKEEKSLYKGKPLPYDFDDAVIERLGEKTAEWKERFLSQLGRNKVAPNTPITEKIIDSYLQLTNPSMPFNERVKEAEKKAREDGYTW